MRISFLQMGEKNFVTICEKKVNKDKEIFRAESRGYFGAPVSKC